MIETLTELFKRDLNKVRSEIESYKNESRIWHFEKNISNSAGNLCLHLIGNLNAYIGVALTRTSYVRQRDLEFSLKNIPRVELIKKIDETLVVLEKGLGNLSEDQLKNNFPIKIWEKKTEIEYTLIHLATHLNYHLGQINYHRRLLDE